MAIITSANSQFQLIVPLLGLNQQLQGYATDDAFSSESVAISENRVGVDGLKSSGWLPQLVNQTISLQADSTSVSFFNDLAQAMNITKEIYFITGVLVIPSLSIQYDLLQGTLQNFQAILNAQNVMQAPQYILNWGSYLISPLSVA